MKQTFKTLMCAAVVGVALSGCSYFDTSHFEEPVEPAEVVEQPISSVQNYDPSELMRNRLNDNVAMYGLDGDVAAPVYVGQGSRSPVTGAVTNAGRVYSDDPSVEVFLFDDQLMPASYRADPYARQAASGSPVMTRPQGAQGAPLTRGDAVAQTNADSEIGRIYFDHGSSMLTPNAKAALGTRVPKTMPLAVTGYASQRANAQSLTERQIINLRESLDRAFEVSKILIQSGVPAENIMTSAWGEAHLSGPDEGMDSEASSRRVEIAPR